MDQERRFRPWPAASTLPQCRPNRKLPEVGTCHKRSLFLFDDRTLRLTQAHRRQDQAGRLFVHLFIPSRRLERLLLQRWSSRRIGHLFRVVETGTVACMRRHGLEKSDPSIVAMKSATKRSIRCGADGAKGGTKGNANQQRTRRTQSRSSVSQALGRIRKSAERFAVTHPRWEPYAGKPHARFCAGGAQQ